MAHRTLVGAAIAAGALILIVGSKNSQKVYFFFVWLHILLIFYLLLLQALYSSCWKVNAGNPENPDQCGGQVFLYVLFFSKRACFCLFLFFSPSLLIYYWFTELMVKMKKAPVFCNQGLFHLCHLLPENSPNQ